MPTPGNLRSIRPNDPPLVEAAYFADFSDFSQRFADGLPKGSEFTTNYFWRFNHPEGKETAFAAASAVGSVSFMMTLQYPEFREVGQSALPGEFSYQGVTRGVGILAFYKTPGASLHDPAHTHNGLVIATNKMLRALSSPYQLPLPK